MPSQYRKKVGDHGDLHAQPVSAMRDMWAKVAVCGEEEPGAGAFSAFSALHFVSLPLIIHCFRCRIRWLRFGDCD